jgi:hypothetical protein
MASFDYYVGFEREPELKGLESFLKKEGYTRTEKTKDSIDYESKNELVDISYYPKAEKAGPGEEPDWEEAGFNVISQITVTTGEDWEESLRISEKLAKKYDAIFYDPEGEDFSREGD